jgi:hypothetical protein
MRLTALLLLARLPADASALLEELICQRTAQDYQHIVSDEMVASSSKSAGSGGGSGSGALSTHTTTHHFSLRNQLHQITIDHAAQTINVRRLVHKRVSTDKKNLVSVHTASSS